MTEAERELPGINREAPTHTQEPRAPAQPNASHDGRTAPLPGDPPSAPLPAVDRFVGHRLAHFDVIARLGEGGMGVVYRALDTRLRRHVALKVVSPRVLARSLASEWRARLVREAQAMARLSHPNVVAVYEVGVADEHVFIAMELVEGSSLRGALAKEPRTWRQTLAIFLEAGDGLAAAHRAGVIHRDFKPDNVLLGTDGRARVTDFGLARSSDPALSTSPDGSGAPSDLLDGMGLEALTVAGVFFGTPGYMAVEQYEQGPVDVRTDVFAFCASLWNALYGELPFRSEAEVRVGKVREPPRDRGVPGWLRRATQKGLAPFPDDRYPNMAALLASLRADPGERWRRRGKAAALVLGVLGIAGTATAYVFHARSQARARECVVEGSAINAVWNESRALQVRRAFEATRLPYAQATTDAVIATLGEYSRAWSTSATDACLATRVRGEQSDAMLELRQLCLDDRREGLAALAGVLAEADGRVVERAAGAARSLSPVSTCADVDGLSRALRLPLDPRARAEVRALQGELASIAVFRSTAAQPLKRLERLRALRERVTAAGYAPVLVEWTISLGDAESTIDEKAAAGDLERAFHLADRYRVDEKRAIAAIGLAQLASMGGGAVAAMRNEDAHRWLRLAESAIARAGDPPGLASQRDVEEGWVFQSEQKWSDAAPLFRRAISRLHRFSDSTAGEPNLLAQAESGLATSLGAEGKFEEALALHRAAVADVERDFGAEHPFVTVYLNNLADAQIQVGAADDARATLVRTLALVEGRVSRGEISKHAPVVGWPSQTMGELLLRVGRPSEAAPYLERAREIYRTAHGPTTPDVAVVDYELSEAYRLLARMRDAQTMLGDAEDIARTAPVPDGVQAGILVQRVRLLLDAGDHLHATSAAERAVSLREKESPPRDLAQARLVLARALSPADPRRARDLAERARQGFDAARDPAGRDEAAAFARGLP